MMRLRKRPSWTAALAYLTLGPLLALALVALCVPALFRAGRVWKRWEGESE